VAEINLFKDLSEEEVETFLEVAKLLGLNFNLNTKIPKAVKIIRTYIKCKFCGAVVVQYIKMAQWTNGVWLKEENLTSDKLIAYEECAQEDSELVFPYCCICKDVYKMIMTWKKEEDKEFE